MTWHKWENKIKFDLHEVGWVKGMDWLLSGSSQGQVVVSFERSNELGSTK